MKKYNNIKKWPEERTLRLYQEYVERLDNEERYLIHQASRFFDTILYNLERYGYEHRARHLTFMLGWD